MLLALLLANGIALAETLSKPPKLSVVSPDTQDREMNSKTLKQTLEPQTTEGNADGAIVTRKPGTRFREKDTPVINKPKPVPGAASPTGNMQKPGGFMESDSSGSSTP